MQNVARNPQQDNPMVEAEDLLRNARTSFMLASKAKTQADIERYAAIGRDYLGLAHEAARVDEQPARLRDLP